MRCSTHVRVLSAASARGVPSTWRPSKATWQASRSKPHRMLSRVLPTFSRKEMLQNGGGRTTSSLKLLHMTPATVLPGIRVHRRATLATTSERDMLLKKTMSMSLAVAFPGGVRGGESVPKAVVSVRARVCGRTAAAMEPPAMATPRIVFSVLTKVVQPLPKTLCFRFFVTSAAVLTVARSPCAPHAGLSRRAFLKYSSTPHMFTLFSSSMWSLLMFTITFAARTSCSTFDDSVPMARARQASAWGACGHQSPRGAAAPTMVTALVVVAYMNRVWLRWLAMRRRRTGVLRSGRQPAGARERCARQGGCGTHRVLGVMSDCSGLRRRSSCDSGCTRLRLAAGDRLLVRLSSAMGSGRRELEWRLRYASFLARATVPRASGAAIARDTTSADTPELFYTSRATMQRGLCTCQCARWHSSPQKWERAQAAQRFSFSEYWLHPLQMGIA